MKNWRILSLVFVCVIAALVWEMLPAPTARAQDIVKLPPGVTVKEQKIDATGGIPGVKKLTWNRLEMKPGAKWANVEMGAVWDLCYVLAGTFTVTGADGKTSTTSAGTAFTIPLNAKIPLLANKGKVTAVDIFWEIGQ